MKAYRSRLKKFLLGAVLMGFAAITPGLITASRAQTSPPAKESKPNFDALATTALQVMKARAEALGIQGVALVAYIPGDEVDSWTSKMRVVGKMTNQPGTNDSGANLLGIAYTKAAEMAATLKDSGSGVRPPMTGEYGWQGGLIIRGNSGFLLAAFSGGPSEDDLKVSRAGLDVLVGKL